MGLSIVPLARPKNGVSVPHSTAVSLHPVMVKLNSHPNAEFLRKRFDKEKMSEKEVYAWLHGTRSKHDISMASLVVTERFGEVLATLNEHATTFRLCNWRAKRRSN